MKKILSLKKIFILLLAFVTIGTSSLLLPQISKTVKVEAAPYYNSSNYYGCWSYYHNQNMGQYPTIYPSSSHDSSGWVEVLQTHLNQVGYNCGTPDGYYGAATVAAVKALQNATYNSYKGYGLQSISADGVAGPYTWGKLEILFFGYSSIYN
ncbi:peptidoglycan-binding domain-containing protein [Clostridium akagii]|uniref:peptidoglycan-binding domain-containing protein n=1 Tax=Clostridium akagii TaxID=91623 RepID=UPI00047B3E9E|nr:peptidoglycan-binding domain-containing protein [Clostridium akagii]